MAHPDCDLLAKRRSAAATAAVGARHPAGAAAAAAADVAVRPASAHAVCVAGALAARALWQLAVCLINLRAVTMGAVSGQDDNLAHSARRSR